MVELLINFILTTDWTPIIIAVLEYVNDKLVDILIYFILKEYIEKYYNNSVGRFPLSNPLLSMLRH